MADYQINDEYTMNELYGDIVLEWQSDLLILRSVREAAQSKMLINKNANYQLREIIPQKKKVNFEVLDRKTIKEIARKSSKKNSYFEKDFEEDFEENEIVVNKGYKRPKKIFQNVGAFSNIITKKSDKIKIIIPDYDHAVIHNENYLDGINEITLPSESAIVIPKIRQKLTTFSNTSIYRNDMEKISSDIIAPILKEIDPNRLITGRANRKGQEIYSLQEVQEYARRLGISVSNKTKKRLIDNILKMIEDQADEEDNKEFN